MAQLFKPECYRCGYLNPRFSSRYKCHVYGKCPATYVEQSTINNYIEMIEENDNDNNGL